MHNHLQQAFNEYAKPSNPDQGSQKSLAVQNAILVSDFITCREEKPPGLPHAVGNAAFRLGF